MYSLKHTATWTLHAPATHPVLFLVLPSEPHGKSIIHGSLSLKKVGGRGVEPQTPNMEGSTFENKVAMEKTTACYLFAIGLGAG